MTDVVKKAVIRASSLPLVSPENKYIVRYRIVSQDQNRFSHWSPIYNIDALPIDQEEIQGSISYNSGTRQVSIGWTDEVKPPYDIFLQVDGGAWKYLATTTNTSYQYYVRTTLFGDLTFRVQKASYYKDQPSPALEMFEGTVTVAGNGIQ